MSLASLVRFFAVLSFFFFFFGFVFVTLLGAWCLGGEKTWESKGFSGFVNFFWVY